MPRIIHFDTFGLTLNVFPSLKGYGMHTSFANILFDFKEEG